MANRVIRLSCKSDEAQTMMPSGISRVSQAVAEQVAGDTTSVGTRVFALPLGIRDKNSLFCAIRKVLPLDPPMTGGRENWDALEDSLWAGLHSITESNVVIIWPDASEMQRTSSKEFETAIAILGDVARTLGDPKVTNGPVKGVAFILGGTWA